MTTVESARTTLLVAAARLAQAYAAEGDDPNYDAEQEYAAELVALAARELVAATDRLPADQQPVGWADTTTHTTPTRGTE